MLGKESVVEMSLFWSLKEVSLTPDSFTVSRTSIPPVLNRNNFPLSYIHCKFFVGGTVNVLCTLMRNSICSCYLNTR